MKKSASLSNFHPANSGFRRLTILSTVLVCGALMMALGARADSNLSQSAAPASGTSSGNGTVKGNNVRVRARAATMSEVVALAKKGDMLQVLDRKAIQEGGKSMEWLQVVLPGNATCYVNLKLLKDGEATTDAVYVRCGPGTNYRDVGKLAKGEKVDVIRTRGEWVEIKPTTHCTGWIAAEYVEVAAPAPPPVPVASAPVTPPVVSAPVAAVPEATMPPAAGIKPAEPEDEVRVDYVVKDGILEPVKDETNPPASYELRTLAVEGRSYRLAYLDTTEKNLTRYEGKHVKIFGNQRWRKSERYPVIAVERIDMVW